MIETKNLLSATFGYLPMEQIVQRKGELGPKKEECAIMHMMRIQIVKNNRFIQ